MLSPCSCPCGGELYLSFFIMNLLPTTSDTIADSINFPTATLKTPSLTGILDVLANSCIIESISSLFNVTSVALCPGFLTIILSFGPLHSIVWITGLLIRVFIFPRFMSTPIFAVG